MATTPQRALSAQQPTTTYTGSMNWRNFVSQSIVYLLATVAAILFALPFLWTIGSSLKPITEIFAFPPTLWPAEPRWANYADVFRIAPFGRFIYNTAFITAFAMIGQILSASAV
ncbi:MAG: carbohydrate ABC transporter permease, partial [Caldilineaceae bacterium]|nr:carbohydrate ABC transporter permease [Caldilineaceae bacterium]